MTDTCIVCLGDLRVDEAEAIEGVVKPSLRHDDYLNRHEEEAAALDAGADTALSAAPHPTNANNQSKLAEDDEIIAHLLPCGHNMHDSCLRPWVERANSCPICRAQFNMVELRRFLGSPAFSSYAVQEKQQQAEVDPTLVIEEDLLDSAEQPCVVCGAISHADVMYCDGCEGTVHVFCAGYTDATAPDVWYCEECLGAMDDSHSASRRRAANITRQTGRVRGGATSEWDRVWQQVWRRVNLDLDFPFDDEPASTITTIHRTPAQVTELEAWQQRLQVANRQGGANRFRETAPTLLRRPQAPLPQPESQEELRAWNAFDKAKQLTHEHEHDDDDDDDDEVPTAGRKRKSITGSPASPRGSDAAPERKLKRPRTRRNQTGPEPGPSSLRPTRPPHDHPSFLTSLLQEVEKQPAPSDSPDDEKSADEQHSPYVLSPAASPLQSGRVSPRASSVTPPPPIHPRPSSPTPLTSIVRPLASPIMSAPFSPFSPAIGGKNERGRHRVRPAAQPSSPTSNASPSSPSRNMSYTTKTEIQRMVKAVLAPRYRENQISKDQYTDINRDVSRMLYEKIGDAEGLADQKEREKWQQVALEGVDEAIDAIRARQQHDESTPTTTTSL